MTIKDKKTTCDIDIEDLICNFIQKITNDNCNEVTPSSVSNPNVIPKQAMVAETDLQASALGYKADASKVDKAKYSKYAAGQACVNCALYQVATGSAAGGCPLFAGKQVAAKGWCSAYAKKPKFQKRYTKYKIYY